MLPRITQRPITRTNTTRNTESTTIPAPTLGLNSISNLVEMPATSAITLKNFIVRPYGCETRAGSKKHATAITGTVESLMVYAAGSQSGSRLFAAANGSIYDVTTTGTPSIVKTELALSKFESVNFSTPGGRYMIAVNGVDAALLFDGTSWTDFTTVASPSAPGQVSGVDTTLWSNITHYKLRVWAVERNSLKAWYLPINSVGGAATSFDFGAYTRKGGHLVALASWSKDAGKGLDDYFVAVTSEGEMLVYEGTDPASSDSWRLVGIWEVEPPASTRCFIKYGPELLYLSGSGVNVFSKYIASDGIDTNSALSAPIKQILSEESARFSNYFGWEMVYFPTENVVLVNVPSNTTSTQYVFNTITRAWSSFVGWDAKCFAVFNGSLFFGENGGVKQAFAGYSDNAETNGLGGIQYEASAQQAFNYFETPGIKKHFKLVRLTATATVAPLVSIGVNADFDFGIGATSSSQASAGYSAWNSALWNSALWSRESGTIKNWHTTHAIGFAASLTVVVRVTGKVTWASTDWIFEKGGSL